MRTYFLDDMTAAYIEAAYFTDGEENEDMDFTREFKTQAYSACYHFEDAANKLGIDVRQYSPEQLGHDLWLTRNGHGAGFWDRDFEHKDIFTALARAQGAHDVEFA